MQGLFPHRAGASGLEPFADLLIEMRWFLSFPPHWLGWSADELCWGRAKVGHPRLTTLSVQLCTWLRLEMSSFPGACPSLWPRLEQGLGKSPYRALPPGSSD